MLIEKLKASIQAGDEGTFKAIASAAGSVAYGERGPTRFAKGAFRESLEASGGKFPLLWQHRDDQPIGVARLSEGDAGLILDGTLAMDVQQGKEAHSLLKLGGIDGVSIGFNVSKAKHVTLKGESVREVEKANLAEVSLVTFPADSGARVEQVHSEGALAHEIADLASVLESLENVAGHVDEGQAGRVFSAANLKQLREALGSLVGLIEKVDPGHVASLGRKAARFLKKSFLNTQGAKKRNARRRNAARMAALRAAQMHLAYPGADIDPDEIPAARLFDDIKDEEEKREEQWRMQSALMDSIHSILRDPRVAAKGDMVRDTVNQYLIAVGEAEGNDDDDDESDAGLGAGERHINDPRVEKRGEKWAVVDADGKIYGEHDSKGQAEAQRRALLAAAKEE
jgi:HK97 family phage prohead protease